MQNLHERPASRKIPEQPDLFSWFPAPGTEASATAAPRAVRKLSERFRLSTDHARAVARLAGFQMEVA